MSGILIGVRHWCLTPNQMKRTELTARQHTVVEAIQAWIKEHGFPPTIRELGKLLGIKSLRGVTTHLDALAKKGHLDRKRGARSIRVLKTSSGTSLEPVVKVPILGRIAAGQPLLAQEQLDGELVVSPSLLGAQADASSYFALKVRGRSMQGAGILNGDYVIIRQQLTADNGQIVAALVGEEATIKRLFREDDRIRLQPENPAMEPLILAKDQPLQILGKVVAVFRQLP